LIASLIDYSSDFRIRGFSFLGFSFFSSLVMKIWMAEFQTIDSILVYDEVDARGLFKDVG
jgi:hypothetical protein